MLHTRNQNIIIVPLVLVCIYFGKYDINYANNISIDPSNFDQLFGLVQFPINPSDGTLCPSQLDHHSELYENSPTQNQPGIYLNIPECNSTTVQQNSLDFLGLSNTISQASPSGSKPKKSKSPDIKEGSQSKGTDTFFIRWPSPDSSGRNGAGDLDDNNSKRGKRKSALHSMKRIKVSKTRHIGACMSCSIAKIEVILILLY